MVAEEVIEYLENLIINNPYPENIFTPIPKEDYSKINNLLKKEMGYPIDRLSGNIGNRLYKALSKDLVKVISWLKQIEKDRAEDAWGQQFEKEIASND